MKSLNGELDPLTHDRAIDALAKGNYVTIGEFREADNGIEMWGADDVASLRGRVSVVEDIIKTFGVWKSEHILVRAQRKMFLVLSPVPDLFPGNVTGDQSFAEMVGTLELAAEAIAKRNLGQGPTPSDGLLPAEIERLAPLSKRVSAMIYRSVPLDVVVVGGGDVKRLLSLPPLEALRPDEAQGKSVASIHVGRITSVAREVNEIIVDGGKRFVVPTGIIGKLHFGSLVRIRIDQSPITKKYYLAESVELIEDALT